MKLKNVEVEPFIEFLLSFELVGRNSRLRTRFVKLLMERQKLIDQEHYELITQYANMDESGNPKISVVNDIQMYDMKDVVSFNREYHILLSEDFVIDQNEERKEMLLFIKDLVLDCEMSFKGDDAFAYDRWCEICEEIAYD